MSEEVGPSMIGGADESVLLLVLCLALATVWVAGCADLCHITNHGCYNCANTREQEDDPDPVMPYVRCEHDPKRSE